MGRGDDGRPAGAETVALMYGVLWLASVARCVAELVGVKRRRQAVADENIRRRNIYEAWISIAGWGDVFYAGWRPTQAPRVV